MYLKNIDKILYTILFLFLISCESANITKDVCLSKEDCSLTEDCIAGKCVEYQYCSIDTDCENKRCINGRCKDVECIIDDECLDDKRCSDFICIDIKKQEIGASCYSYGNSQCLSNYCLIDEFASYCSDTCIDDTQCPNGMKCFGEGVKYCQYGELGGDKSGGYGSNCIINGQSDCNDRYTCVKNIYNRGKDRCLKECKKDRECYFGYRCVSSESEEKAYCMPPKYRKEGELCTKYDGLECKNDDNNCILLTESEKFCTRECKDDTSCNDGNICSTFGDKKYCVKSADSTFGKRCDQMGSLQCIDGLVCDWEYHQGALCTKSCLNDAECGAYYSCSLLYNGEKYCRPAPNNLGDRTGILGDNCFEHGDSDCKNNMLCLAGSLNNKHAYCTYHCELDSDCIGDYFCSDPTKTGNKLCVKGKKGELGASCIQSACNQGLFCYKKYSKDLTAYCSKNCETHENCEKDGYYCNNVYRTTYLCTEDEPEDIHEGNLGDKCPTGYCKTDLNCIFDPNGNFCSKPCTDSCVDGFECLNYDQNSKFCYPIQ